MTRMKLTNPIKEKCKQLITETRKSVRDPEEQVASGIQQQGFTER